MPFTFRRRNAAKAPALGVALASALSASLSAAEPARCEARSGAVPLTVVELYTSEGCSSCPPADRWLATLGARTDVLPLAFHVSYWDQLGWVDRFASPAHNERQRQVQAATAGRYVYTPQVVVNGQDWRAWANGLPKPAAAPAPVAIVLSREGDRVNARITPVPGQPAAARLAGYWVVLEDGHRSAVRAGENAGEQLRHEDVVRLYQPVPSWAAGSAPPLSLTLPPAGAQPRRVAFVVTEGGGVTRPLQAAVLGC